MKVVREGQTHRAPIERVADLLTGYFVPVVTLLAIITWVVWLALGLSGTLPRDYLDISVGGWREYILPFIVITKMLTKCVVFVIQPCGHLSSPSPYSSSHVPVASG